MDAQVQVMQVTVRTTKTGKQVYDVSCSDGKKRQVWDGNLAQQLNTFAGTQQFVTIRYDVKQNGQYVNESIQAFAPPGGQLPPDTAPQPMQGAMPQALPAGGQPIQQGGNTAPIQAAPQGGSDRFPPEVTTRITKLAAYEYASHVVGGLFAGSGPEGEEEAVKMLDRIAKHVYKAARSHEQQQDEGQALPPGTITSPQGVAEFANAQQPGVVQVGAPVAQQQDAAAEAPDVIDWN